MVFAMMFLPDLTPGLLYQNCPRSQEQNGWVTIIIVCFFPSSIYHHKPGIHLEEIPGRVEPGRAQFSRQEVSTDPIHLCQCHVGRLGLGKLLISGGRLIFSRNIQRMVLGSRSGACLRRISVVYFVLVGYIVGSD